MRGGWRIGAAIALSGFVWRCSSEDALPPADPGAGTSQTASITTFALDSVLLGDTDEQGIVSGSAWMRLGYDLDGKLTTHASVDVCDLIGDAPKSNQTDGIAGRDNGFGASILPIVETVSVPVCGDFLAPCEGGAPPPLSTRETQAIRGGAFTLQIVITGLADDPNQSSDGLHAEVFDSDAFDDGSPAFDSSTDWPVLPESLADGTDIPAGALAHFASAYVTDGTFVAGANEHVTLPLHAVINGFAFTLHIHEAIVTFDHIASDEAANGVLAGVLDVQELTSIFQRQGGGVNASLCGTTFAGIADQIAQAADILSDRTNHAGSPCTAISFGIGFHARRIANPTKVAPPLDYPDPCDASADAGTD